MADPNMMVPAVSMAEAQAYARVETGEEEALLAGLVRTATGLCEAFTGQVLVERGFAETVAADGRWQRLSTSPVRRIDTVGAVAVDGSVSAVAVGDYEIEIDRRGDGWVRSARGGQISVNGRAGMAADSNGTPEPLRQGILRLVAHLFATRDGIAGEPPAAVTALWRPYRRMRMI